MTESQAADIITRLTDVQEIGRGLGIVLARLTVAVEYAGWLLLVLVFFAALGRRGQP